MTEDVSVGFGLQFADPKIPWPKRGSAESTLCERDGWMRGTLPTMSNGEAVEIEAMSRGDLAVHLMLGSDEGFAISTSNRGWRISYGGAVFARCEAAMMAAELLMDASAGWQKVEECGFTNDQREALRRTVRDAELRGDIMLDRVYPK